MDNPIVSFWAKFRPHCCLTAVVTTFVGILFASKALRMKMPAFSTICALLFAFLLYGFLCIAIENSMQNPGSASFPSRKQRYVPVAVLILLVVLSYLISPWTLSVLFGCCVLNLLSAHLMRYRFFGSLVYGCANVAFLFYGMAMVCDEAIFTKLISYPPLFSFAAFLLYLNFLFKYFNSIGVVSSESVLHSADELCFKTGKTLKSKENDEKSNELAYYIGCVLLLVVVLFDFTFLMHGIRNLSISTWGFFGLFFTAYLGYLVKRKDYHAVRRVNCEFFLLQSSLFFIPDCSFLTWFVVTFLSLACVELIFKFLYPEKD